MTTIELLPNCYYRFTKRSFDEKKTSIVFEAKLIEVIGNTLNVVFYTFAHLKRRFNNEKK